MYDRRVNYELYMSAALSEARAAAAAGESADGAVAVLDEAMVARGHNQVVAPAIRQLTRSWWSCARRLAGWHAPT